MNGLSFFDDAVHNAISDCMVKTMVDIQGEKNHTKRICMLHMLLDDTLKGKTITYFSLEVRRSYSQD